MDGQNGPHPPGRARSRDVIGRQTALPVMRMNQIGLPILYGAIRDFRGRPAQRGKAFRVIHPIHTGLVQIRACGPVIQMRRIEDQQIQPCDGGGQQVSRPAETIVEPGDGSGILHHPHDHRISRQQGPHGDAKWRQRAGQRPGHIGQAARLDQRHAFRCDRKNLHYRAALHLSTMSWVISVTPRSETRKNFASSA